ncbi:MAG: Na+/H+ antiporter NhaC [Planctomycetes bacterium]|nr:Na+/H+ antiporter NhaC [Planctomycetota bacterium]
MPQASPDPRPAPQAPHGPHAPSEALPSFWLSLIPVLALVAMLLVNVRWLGSADNHVPLVLATAAAGLLATLVLRQPWKRLEKGLIHSITMALQACLILMVVGMLIGAWIDAGVVPLMIVWGLELISPSVFLVTACVVCCIVSLATGSSWTTAGTVGVALIGVGTAMGLEPGMVAGAVVSGSYFGDKMSPLSDTTNLAPAMAGATLIEHVRHMVWTVTPALLGALAVYAWLGMGHTSGPESLGRVRAVVDLIEGHFVLSPWLIAPPVVVLVLVARNFPALPALLVGTFLASLIGFVVQAHSDPRQAVQTACAVLYGGYAIDLSGALGADATEVQREAVTTVQSLLDGRGGMKSMMGTVALIFCALSFGGIMEASGMLGAIAKKLLSVVRGTGSLIAATIFTCLGVNVLASDQYMAIVVPGRMFRTAYLDRRLHPKNLSRALEDSGTVTSALIPWNTCGAQMATVLGVATAAYWPYAILNWLCPLVSIVYGMTGFTITRITDEEAQRYRDA